jgi:hypothetical protein
MVGNPNTGSELKTLERPRVFQLRLQKGYAGLFTRAGNSSFPLASAMSTTSAEPCLRICHGAGVLFRAVTVPPPLRQPGAVVVPDAESH